MNRRTPWALTPDELKQAMIQIHLDHLHTVQLDMIDEAVEKSEWNEARSVINHVMEMKSEK